MARVPPSSRKRQFNIDSDEKHENHVPKLKKALHSHYGPQGTTSSQSTFRFMDLPGELRNRVYDIVIADLSTEFDMPITLNHCDCQVIDLLDPLIPTTLDLPAQCFRRKKEARMVLTACSLREVSSSIRKEFISLLWRAQVFQICTCNGGVTLLPGDHLDWRIFKALPPSLTGNIPQFVFHTHEEFRYGVLQFWPKKRSMPDRFFRLVDVLRMLKFKGLLRVKIPSDIVESTKELFETVIAGVRGYADREEVLVAAERIYQASICRRSYGCLRAFWVNKSRLAEVSYKLNFGGSDDGSVGV